MFVKKYRMLFCGFLIAFMIATFLIGNGYIKAEGGTAPPNPAGGAELTVYNNDLALVKDRRILELPSGTGTVSFTEVAAAIDPTSVRFRALNAPGIRVLEQNFEYDVMNDIKLLQKFLGQKISLTTLKGDIRTGFLLSGGDNMILATRPDGGTLEVIKANQIQSISFPELPSGLVIQPTLVWLLANPDHPARARGPQPVEVTYLTGGLSWRADYIATVNQNDDRVDLTGWVTLDNKSGAAYHDTRLKLVAGDVNRAPEENPVYVKRYLMDAAGASPKESGFQEQSFFEYHLYTLNRTTTLKNNQLKQVELLSVDHIQAKKRFIFEAASDPKKVKVMLELKNSRDLGLGIPLPKGIIRVQKADQDGALQFIGEDRIDHTPQDEKIRINLGNAFDIVGERTRINVKEVSGNSREESFRIALRNHKKTAAAVTVVENMYNWPEWKIIGNDHPFVKTESGKVEFPVNIPADGEVTINYTLRYKW